LSKRTVVGAIRVQQVVESLGPRGLRASTVSGSCEARRRKFLVSPRDLKRV